MEKTIKELVDFMIQKRGYSPFNVRNMITIIECYEFLKGVEEPEIACQCEHPVPQATLSHACQNCHKLLKGYAKYYKK